MMVIFDLIMLTLVAMSLLLWGILAWQWYLLRHISNQYNAINLPPIDHLALFYSRKIYLTHFLSQGERGRLLSYALCQVLPLQGLLGTVVGMIDIFNALAEHQQTTELHQGISLALLSTFAGLTTAIPALFFISYLEKGKEACWLSFQSIYSIGRDS